VSRKHPELKTTVETEKQKGKRSIEIRTSPLPGHTALQNICSTPNKKCKQGPQTQPAVDHKKNSKNGKR
jgi:hypothetical protein